MFLTLCLTEHTSCLIFISIYFSRQILETLIQKRLEKPFAKLGPIVIKSKSDYDQDLVATCINDYFCCNERPITYKVYHVIDILFPVHEHTVVFQGILNLFNVEYS